MEKYFALCILCACAAANTIPTSRELDKSDSDDDVKLYFRNKNNLNNENPLNMRDTSELQSLGFSTEKLTVFLIHGWFNEEHSTVNKDLTEAYLYKYDVNIFVVDWSKLACNTYEIASASIKRVGYIVGNYLKALMKDYNLDLNNTAIIGHSLGAHVAGMVGHDVGGKVSYIVGLDPALPLFMLVHIDERLDSSDAQFVQVIHTCAGLLGIFFDIGDSDYYPNGGSKQPGCQLDLLGTCSHGRSYQYFAESLKSGGFQAQKCENYDDFKNAEDDRPNHCSKQGSYLGGFNIDRSASGPYYLDTHSYSPYSKH